MKEDTKTTQKLEEPPSSQPDVAPGEIIIGELVEFDDHGVPFVDYSENPTDSALPAMTTQRLTQQHVGRQVALLFANGDAKSPIIMGVIHSPLHDMLDNFEHEQSDNQTEVEVESNLSADDVLIDGKRITFDAKEEIVLKCGESSITLTKSGKILIRGKYLLNRSSGVNRIMGGSVQVN